MTQFHSFSGVRMVADDVTNSTFLATCLRILLKVRASKMQLFLAPGFLLGACTRLDELIFKRQERVVVSKWMTRSGGGNCNRVPWLVASVASGKGIHFVGKQ